MFSCRKHLRNESVFETKIKLCFDFFLFFFKEVPETKFV